MTKNVMPTMRRMTLTLKRLSSTSHCQRRSDVNPSVFKVAFGFMGMEGVCCHLSPQQLFGFDMLVIPDQQGLYVIVYLEFVNPVVTL